MSTSGLTSKRPFYREAPRAACTVATVSILTCGFVTPTVEAHTTRSTVRVVELTSRYMTLVDPLGVGTSSDPAAVHAQILSAAQRLPAGELVDGDAIPPGLQTVSPDLITEVSTGGPMLATRLISLLLQPLLWLAEAVPESLKPLVGGFVLFAGIIGGFVGGAIDAVLDPILRLFGIGGSTDVPSVAAQAVEETSESVPPAVDVEMSQQISESDDPATENTAAAEVMDLNEAVEITEATETTGATEATGGADGTDVLDGIEPGDAARETLSADHETSVQDENQTEARADPVESQAKGKKSRHGSEQGSAPGSGAAQHGDDPSPAAVS